MAEDIAPLILSLFILIGYILFRKAAFGRFKREVAVAIITIDAIIVVAWFVWAYRSVKNRLPYYRWDYSHPAVRRGSALDPKLTNSLTDNLL